MKVVIGVQTHWRRVCARQASAKCYGRSGTAAGGKTEINLVVPPPCLNFALCERRGAACVHCKITKKRRNALATIVKKILSFCLPFVLGIAILWWMYRRTDWTACVGYLRQMNWGWMLFSLIFGVLAQQVRAWRWKMALTPLGLRTRRRVCEDAIFLSYASSLVVPRIGEVARCGTLKRYDGVPFAKALGTVVTERVVDSLLMLVLTLAAFMLQLKDFLHFLKQTGTDFGSSFSRYTDTGFVLTVVCIVAVVSLAAWLLRRFSIFSKGKDVVRNVWAGVTSLRHVRDLPLYLALSLGIWLCYYLHFYTAFFCFDFTSDISPVRAFLIFCIGTFAVIVPTPNGAGPWHFAVKTMLVLYGVSEEPAIMFALIVHSIQTFEVILLGVFAWIDLARRRRLPPETIVAP